MSEGIVEKVEAMYLDFLNNYMTISAFATAYCISEGFARALISEAQLMRAIQPSVESRDRASVAREWGYSDGYEGRDRCNLFTGVALNEYQDGLAAGSMKKLSEDLEKNPLN